MSTLDFGDMSATMRHMITGLAERNIPGPLYVAKNGQQIAVIIRSEAYAPRLHLFAIGANNDGTPYICCDQCDGFNWTMESPRNLGAACEAANKHWRETHREPR